MRAPLFMPEEHVALEAALVISPEEGHGVRRYPAIIDFLTRATAWFARHMPPDPG